MVLSKKKPHYLETNSVFILNYFTLRADFHVKVNKILKYLSVATVKNLVRVTCKMKSGVGPAGY